jgi:Holliday junction resolvase
LVNSRQKGAAGENLVRDLLSKSSGYVFERTPGSGSGKIKGDLYIPLVRNTFCIEVKNYAESPLSDKILVNKTNNLAVWWSKLQQQAKQVNQEPLLIFKYNRSKLYVVTSQKPTNVINYLYISSLSCYIMLCEEWLNKETIIWQIL